jgi:hypothetical protein
MSFLSTSYLGLDLRTPLVASAGPLSQTLDGIKALADGGVGAVVMYSLFEEQIRAEEARNARLELDIEDSFAEATSYFPVVPKTGTHVDAASASPGACRMRARRPWNSTSTSCRATSGSPATRSRTGISRSSSGSRTRCRSRSR